MALATAAIYATDYTRLRQEADASQATVMSPGAPCNHDAETFSEFLVKFTTDAGFNSERCDISAIFAIKPISDYRALVVTQGHEAGYMQLWETESASKVKLVCKYAGAPADYSYIFERHDGKWRLIDRLTEDF